VLKSNPTFSSEKGAIFTFGKSNFADNVQSKFWLKNDHAVKIACGEDHTAVITGRLYDRENISSLSVGSNTNVFYLW
jgi:X-linked retinitis pigmentosa GTPase regulator